MTAPMFHVKVPATSANLGPGFDCLGIALGLFNEMTLTSNRAFQVEITGEACDLLPTDRTNTVVQAIDVLLDEVDATKVPRDFHLLLKNSIPVGSGLGSSASAIVGGLLLGSALIKHYEPSKEPAKRRLLELASALEGHPDNVSPALYGGASLTWQEEGELRYIPVPTPAALSFVVATPYFALPTEMSRQVVPLQVSRADAVYNIAQASRLMIALCTGQLHLLRGGYGDRLHEPYRQRLIPGFQDVARAAIRKGALATTLSGAGPSLLAWCDDERIAWTVADEMTIVWREHGIPCRTDVFAVWQAATTAETYTENAST